MPGVACSDCLSMDSHGDRWGLHGSTRPGWLLGCRGSRAAPGKFTCMGGRGVSNAQRAGWSRRASKESSFPVGFKPFFRLAVFRRSVCLWPNQHRPKLRRVKAKLGRVKPDPVGRSPQSADMGHTLSDAAQTQSTPAHFWSKQGQLGPSPPQSGRITTSLAWSNAAQGVSTPACSGPCQS